MKGKYVVKYSQVLRRWGVYRDLGKGRFQWHQDCNTEKGAIWVAEILNNPEYASQRYNPLDQE